MKELNPKKIKDRIMKIGYETKCSHIASSMSVVNLLCTIYNKWPEANVILSKGHGALALYVILNELGKLPDKVLKTFYKDGGLGIHSTLNKQYGIMASTGSLGHGLAIGIGYAIADKERVTIVVMSDGEMNEGSTLEALQIINRLKIDNILPIVDWNDCQGFMQTEDIKDMKYRNFYSIKGQGFGEDFEGKIESHYTIITDEIYKNWKKQSPVIEKERLEVINQYKSKIQNNG